MPFTSLPVDVVNHILSWSTAPTLTRFAATCHDADDLVNEEFNFRYDTMLSKFIDDRPAFRALLTSTSSSIAGSAAALVAGVRHSYSPGDLDVYCDELGLCVIRDHLTSNERYDVVEVRKRSVYTASPVAVSAAEDLIPITDVDRDFQATFANKDDNETRPPTPTAPNSGLYTSGICAVVHLKRGSTYIDLISSATESSTFPIVNFWSTAPMCFLTGQAIHVLYPRLQEDLRGLLNPFRLPPAEPEDPPPALIELIGKHKAHTRGLIAKYVDRGFNIQRTEHAWDPDVSVRHCVKRKAAACPFAIRWVGDARGMHRSLRGVNARIDSSPFEHGLELFTSVWTRGGDPCGVFCADRIDPLDAMAYTIAREYIE